MSKSRIRKYYVCLDCAYANGGVPREDSLIGGFSGLCGHCDDEKEKTLVPKRNFVFQKYDTNTGRTICKHLSVDPMFCKECRDD